MTSSPRPKTHAEAPVDAWLEVIGAPDAAVQPVVRGSGAAGVQLCSRDGAADRPHNGVVVFAGSPAAAADSIHAVADGGWGRILALSAAGDALGGAKLGPAPRRRLRRVQLADPASSARQVAERLRRWQAIDELVECPHVHELLVGDSPAWRAVLRDAVEVARFTDAAVLITGESGTGKERVAQLIHELDPRPNKRRLVVLDCSTVVPSLSGSEFFGHEKGAFTGAAAAREGAFELAHGGTLFLDEVGELPVPLQAELLRVIQEGTFKRVGSNTWRKSAFRLVCATNRDLAGEQAGHVPQRLLLPDRRLHAAPAEPARARASDILPLFRHFFRQAQPDAEPPELEDGGPRAARRPRLSGQRARPARPRRCGSCTAISAPAW